MGKFSADITKFVKVTKVSADLVVRKLSLDAYTGVLMRSPVDTGRFRANWRVTVSTGAPDTRTADNPAGAGEVEYGDPPSPREVQLIDNKLKGAKFGTAVVISNNLPYAQPLEDGWSKQTNNQPGGILAATFEEIKRNFGNSVAKAMRAARGRGEL